MTSPTPDYSSVQKTENQPTEYSTDQLLVNAALLEGSGDYFLARTLYAYALTRSGGKSSGAMRGLGVCHYGMGDSASARQAFQQWSDHFPSPDAFIWLARSLYQQNNELLALEALHKIEIPEELSKTQRFEFQKLLGNCLVRTGRLFEAESAFRSAITLYPENDGVRVNLGMLELMRKNIPQAVNAFEEAKRLNPKNARATNGLGLAALAVGELASARRLFHAALDIQPKNATAVLQLLSLADSRSEADSIVVRAERLLELEADNEQVRYHLAAWYLGQFKYAQCEKHLTILIKKNPNHEGAQKLLIEVRTSFLSRGGAL